MLNKQVSHGVDISSIRFMSFIISIDMRNVLMWQCM